MPGSFGERLKSCHLHTSVVSSLTKCTCTATRLDNKLGGDVISNLVGLHLAFGILNPVDSREKGDRKMRKTYQDKTILVFFFFLLLDFHMMIHHVAAQRLYLCFHVQELEISGRLHMTEHDSSESWKSQHHAWVSL